jgi:hypothetical protein
VPNSKLGSYVVHVRVEHLPLLLAVNLLHVQILLGVRVRAARPERPVRVVSLVESSRAPLEGALLLAPPTTFELRPANVLNNRAGCFSVGVLGFACRVHLVDMVRRPKCSKFKFKLTSFNNLGSPPAGFKFEFLQEPHCSYLEIARYRM